VYRCYKRVCPSQEVTFTSSIAAAKPLATCQRLWSGWLRMRCLKSSSSYTCVSLSKDLCLNDCLRQIQTCDIGSHGTDVTPTIRRSTALWQLMVRWLCTSPHIMQLSAFCVKFCVKKVKYVHLYSASSRSASNALPLPVSRRWSLQANPTARHQRTLRDHVIRAGVSRNMPVTVSPPFSPGTHSSLGRHRLSRPGCLVPRRDGLLVQRRSPT